MELQTTSLFEALEIEQIAKFALVAVILLTLVALFFHDRYQKQDNILRNYPIIGHLRNLMIFLGVYLRHYLYANDREQLPFNRATRDWIYRAADDIENVESFGSTRNIHQVGKILFVDAPFPALQKVSIQSQPMTIGPCCHQPYTTRSIFNVSGMSYGAISKQAVLALSNGARMAGCWMNTGEGGISPYHLSGGADLVAQIGTAKYGYRDLKGNLDDKRLKAAANLPQVKMFEIKLSQGAKPGRGGLLPAVKVTPEIAEIRGIPPYQDSISPNRHTDIGNNTELLNAIHHIREVTGKPVGFKVVLGEYRWLDDLFSEINKRPDCAPDYICLDSKEGGTGAAPMSLMDYVGLPITESLPVLVDKLIEYNLRDRIKVIASGKLVTPAEVTWALCVGADFIQSARGFMFALGCVQALKCHTNRCPTGITTHDPRYTRGLIPAEKAEKIFHYATNIVHEVGVICHAVGVEEPRQLNRTHARIMTETGITQLLSEYYAKEKL